MGVLSPAQLEHSERHWLHVRDVAELLALSPNTVRRWTDAGRIPARRSPGGHRRYLLEEILALAADLVPAGSGASPGGAGTVELVEPAPAPAPDGFGAGAEGGAPPATGRQATALPAELFAELAATLADEPDELPRRAAQALVALSGASRCEIVLDERGGGRVLVSAGPEGDDAGRPGTLLSALEGAGDVFAVSSDRPRGHGRALRERGCHSLLWAPVRAGGRDAGALELSDLEPRDLTPYLPAAAAVARLVAHVLSAGARDGELAERRRAMQELIGISEEVALAGDVRTFAQRLGERLMTATACDYVDIWRVRDDGFHALMSMDRYAVDEALSDRAITLEEHPGTQEALLAGRPFIVNDLTCDALTTTEVELYHEWGWASSVSLPIMAAGRLVGAIELYDDAERLWEEQLDFLTNVAQLVAGIFENAVLLAETSERSAYLRQLVELAGVLSRAAGPTDLAQAAASTLQRLTGAEDCDVWWLDEGVYRCLASVDRTGLDEKVVGNALDLSVFPATVQALERRELLVCRSLDDPILSDPERDDWAEYGFQSNLTLPLVAGDELVGMIDLFDTRPRDYAEVRDIVVSAGRMVADGLKNAQLLGSLRQSNDGLSELLELGDLVSEADDLEELVRAVAQRLRQVLHAENCDIFRIDDDKLTCLASIDSRGWDEGEIGKCSPLEEFPRTVTSLRENRPIVADDIAALGLAEDELALYSRWGYQSMVSLPLVLDGRPVGLIDVFDTRARDWSELLDFIRNVGRLLAGAFEKAVLVDQLAAGNKDLRMLVDASLEFGATLDYQEMLAMVAARVREVTAADACDIASLEGDEVVTLVSLGEPVDREGAGLHYQMSDFTTYQRAFATQQPALVDDVLADARMGALDHEEAALWGYRASADVPLIVQGEVIGFVSVYKAEPGFFGQIPLVVGLAQIAAQALANARVYRRLDEHARRLTLMTDSALELASTLDLRDILKATAWRLCAAVDVPACTVDIVRGEELVMVMSLTDGLVDEDRLGTRMALGDAGVARDVVATGRPSVAALDDPRLNDRIRAMHRDHPDISWAALPLIVKDQVIGVVELIEPLWRRQFSEGDLETAAAICQVAAIAIANAELFEREQAANRETHLLNEIARRTAASLELEDIVAAVADELQHIIDFDGSGLLLVEGERLTRVIALGALGTALQEDDLLKVDPGFTERLRTSGVVVVRLPEESPIGADHPAVQGYASAAIIGLVSDDVVLGAMALLSNDPRGFDGVDRRLLGAIGTQLSLAIKNASLYGEIKAMHLGNLKALSSALNAKDYYTLGHAARVAAYMVMLGEELHWPDELMATVEEAAYLHDIGKISISDRVLLKAGRLNDQEWAQMRQHPVFSAEIIRPLFAENLVLAVRHHHERYDGQGYPDGLAGEEIPELARAMAVVDAYDAMSCRRPYKSALSYHECLAELERCRGEQFDSAMVDAFLAVLHRLEGRRTAAAAIAAEAAALIPGEQHAVLRSSEDEQRPEYAEIAAVLREVRDSHPPTRFLTTHCKIDQRFVIAVDPEEDELMRSDFGDEIFANDEFAEVLSDTAAADKNTLFADQFGVWVTGLAPIRDASGGVVAVVVADLPALATTAGDATSEKPHTFASMLQTAAVRLSRAEIDAITDALTGLYNHRYLHERLSEELTRSREQEMPLSILFCDLDHFKEYNDRNGHSAGDRALREVAHIIEQSVRNIDIAARYGGEEFVVVLVESALPDALAVGERIRERLTQSGLVAGDQPLTVSIGVATYPDDAARREELLDKADWAMYLAKRRGRNQVVAFTA